MFRIFTFFTTFLVLNSCNMNKFLLDDTSLENTIRYIFDSKATLKSKIAFKVLSMNQTISDIKYLKSSNIDPQDSFGYSLSLSQDGKTLAVGAYKEDSGNGNDPSDNSKQDSGAVYIFQKVQATWTNTIYIKSPFIDSQDFFGYSLDLSKDGNTLAVGAYGEDSGDNKNPNDNSRQNSGAVYIFKKNTTTNSWTSSITYIKPSVIDREDLFGFHLKLNEEGTTLIVAASGEDSGNNDPSNNSQENSGAVYIFKKNTITNSWTGSITYIKPSIIDSRDFFGTSLSLNKDGNILAVGAYGEDSGDSNNPNNNSKQNSGAVYIFKKNTITNSWTSSITYIKPSVIDSDDSFGVSLDLNESGNILVIGAHGEDSAKASIPASNTIPNSGATFIFRKEGEKWKQSSILKSHFIIPYLQFGNKVCISSDGKIITASAPTESGAGIGINSEIKVQSKTNSGAVFTFQNDTPNNSNSSWKPKKYIKAPNTDVSDSFGSSIDLDKNGVLSIGAQGEDSISSKDMKNNRANESGAVYVY